MTAEKFTREKKMWYATICFRDDDAITAFEEPKIVTIWDIAHESWSNYNILMTDKSVKTRLGNNLLSQFKGRLCANEQ